MVYKERTESIVIRIIKLLQRRNELKEKQYCSNLIKGYEGEVLFDSYTKKLECECFVINDLLLQYNNTTFQIDTLVITPDKLYIFEVKNYEGDYYFESDILYKKPKKEVSNPLNQLHRSESLLRQLLQSYGFTIPIQAYVVFVNPAFTLYQAPLTKPIIFPTQLHAFFQNLNKSTAKLNKKHKVLADKLVSLHVEESPYRTLPKYKYSDLRKGICCVNCGSFSVNVVGRKCICQNCGKEEMVVDAVKRSTDELKMLFPELKITTNIIHDWCKVVESKRRIGRILDKFYHKNGLHQWTYYD
ncbi:nuclease-related domain-containing protein [Fredinandcohnia onubensis]|uniref:nuclease-related domain-containing protein n=1 Tax=Fredinandcohnia onubensis TaxID=1571209 RepID=UPI000C0BF848|nr:nuclease-related domain-containing protein [Fredinandcohnia onubensis]